MKKIIYIKSFLLIALLFFVSCNKQLLDYSDPNSINTQSYFNTPVQIQQASIAVYSSFFYNHMFGWRWEEMFDGLANELNPQTAARSNEANIMQFWQYQFTGSNDCISGYWNLLYRMILRANLTIDKGNLYLKDNGANDVVSKSVGEAYFLRGWAYSQLAFYWGRVPIRTTYNQVGKEDAPRAAMVEDVWAVAEADFKQAQTLLPASWDNDNIGRATSGAATGFLGKLYLYTKKYDNADVEFAQLNGKYSLLPFLKWNDNFGETNKNNEESVFEIQLNYKVGITKTYSPFVEPEGAANQPGRENAHQQLYGWNDWNNWMFQPRMVEVFKYKDEGGNPYVDPRAQLTFYGGIGDSIWCEKCSVGPQKYDFAKLGYFYKKNLNKEYKESENTMESSNNIRLMRYADVLLMRAECKIKANVPNIPVAIGFINQVRSRVGAFTYNGSYTAAQAFELLKRERQIELMGEQNRFNDLKRWGILKETMNPELIAIGAAGTFQDKYYLFPIPQTELDTNLGFGTIANGWN